MIRNSLLAIFAAYLLGSIPTGYLAARWARGIDIREAGDRSTGATNVFREAGAKAGIATATGDVAKGAVAMLVARALQVPGLALILTALAVVSGHIWPLFLRFRGGAGLATAAGVLLATLPRESLTLLPPFALLGVTVGRRIGLGLSGALLLVPLLLLNRRFREPPSLTALPLVLGVQLAAKRYWRQALGALAER